MGTLLKFGSVVQGDPTIWGSIYIYIYMYMGAPHYRPKVFEVVVFSTELHIAFWPKPRAWGFARTHANFGSVPFFGFPLYSLFTIIGSQTLASKKPYNLHGVKTGAGGQGLA